MISTRPDFDTFKEQLRQSILSQIARSYSKVRRYGSNYAAKNIPGVPKDKFGNPVVIVSSKIDGNARTVSTQINPVAFDNYAQSVYKSEFQTPAIKPNPQPYMPGKKTGGDYGQFSTSEADRLWGINSGRSGGTPQMPSAPQQAGAVRPPVSSWLPGRDIINMAKSSGVPISSRPSPETAQPPIAPTPAGLTRLDILNIAKNNQIPISSYHSTLPDDDLRQYVFGEIEKKTGRPVAWM